MKFNIIKIVIYLFFNVFLDKGKFENFVILFIFIWKKKKKEIVS